MVWSLLDSGTAVFADGNAGHLFTYPGGTPATNDLLLLCVASDTVVTTPLGWTLQNANSSDVQQMGAYFYLRVAGVAEAGLVTLTTSGDHPTAIAYLRYSGNAASPFDVNQKSAVTNTNGTATPTLPGATLAASGELCVLAVCLHGDDTGTATGVTPSAGYTTLLTSARQGTSPNSAQIAIIARTDGTGSQTPSATWTNAYKDRTALFAAFLQAAGGTTTPVSMAGTLGLSGALTRRTDRTFAGTLPGAGLVQRLTKRTFTGAITPHGQFGRLIPAAFAGTLSLAGTLLTALNPVQAVTSLRARVSGRRPPRAVSGDEPGTE